MTKTIGSAATAKVIERITGPKGFNSSLAALRLADTEVVSPLALTHVRKQNVAAELAERADTIQYPAANVYCEKIVNSLEEKFRSFSGKVRMVVELRHSQDRLEGLEATLEVYADALSQVLHTARGDWGDGMFFGGAYEISFSPMKKGGKNFIQVAKVTFEIGVSRN